MPNREYSVCPDVQFTHTLKYSWEYGKQIFTPFMKKGPASQVMWAQE